MAKRRDNKRKNKSKTKIYLKIGLISIITIVLLLIGLIFFVEKIVIKDSTIDEFEQRLNDNQIAKIDIKETSNALSYVLKNEYESANFQAVYKVKIFKEYILLNPEILDEIKKQEIELKVSSKGVNAGELIFRLVYVLFLILIAFYLIRMFVGMNKSNVEYIDDEESRFSDVGGLNEVKKELETIINYLKDRESLKDYVDKIPKGILFEGDPGNGKTLLARVIAGESNTPFFYISGADIEGSFVAQGAGRVRDIFKKVRKVAQKEGRAILFIDELDSIGTKREKRTVVETNQTINAILTELDGFTESENILVLGATNLASQLDAALIRSGRFDRIIKIPNPSKEDRKEILNLYLNKKKEKVDEEVFNLKYEEILSNQTQGFSASDLSRLVNDAFLLAFEDKSKLTITHLREAYLRIVMGLPNSVKLSEIDRKIIAYHESAHAIVSMYTSDLGYKSLAYGTIRPYGEAGGHVSLVRPETVFMRRSDYFNNIKVLLAGRAIEDKILNGDYTSGASNDLMKVNNLLYSYIVETGMSENNENLFIDTNYGDLKAEWIQEEVKRLREQLYKETKEIINQEYNEIEKLANYLLENNDIDYDEINYRFKEKYPERINNLIDEREG